MTQILKNLALLLQTPNLASKKWIVEQYDSHVMNDTLQTGGDASVVRVHGTKKALAISTDCTPRYVEADPFQGAIQAVAETYRNISAVGAKPLAITNCLNFGNPQKPEIMGQIVRSINGITEACKALDYPVVSGNVSLYNETDGKAIQPTPAIGGVGLIKDLDKRCDSKFKFIGDEIYIIGKTLGHLSCSIFEKEISGIESKTNPPIVDLKEERKNCEFVRELIENSVINACHDISDGGLVTALFEMCSSENGCEIDGNFVANDAVAFGEDQSRFVITIDPSNSASLKKLAEKFAVELKLIGKVAPKKISLIDSAAKVLEEVAIEELVKINQSLFEKKFSNNN